MKTKHSLHEEHSGLCLVKLLISSNERRNYVVPHSWLMSALCRLLSQWLVPFYPEIVDLI